MATTGLLLLAVAGLMAAQDPGADPGADRIWARVTTDDGTVLEGYLRWDRNEASWVDLLDGYRELPEENLRQAEELGAGDRERSVELFGVRVSWEEEADWPGTAESGVRFGHLRRIRASDGDTLVAELKNGTELRLTGGSTDLGPELRGLEIDDGKGRVVELTWEDLDVAEFAAAPRGRIPTGTRLHGTVEDRRGRTYTGYVAWNMDDVLTTDVLGRGGEEGTAGEIRMGDVAAVERTGARSSRVVLRDGRETSLGGSGDVGRGNRGVQIADPALGQVRVGWDELRVLRFHPPADPSGYEDFDGGRRLRGTVRTEDGVEHAGVVRWDNDEEWTWEILDGRSGGVVFDIEFGAVARIEKRSSRSAGVTLRDGRTFELDDSNDLDRDNKGIFVTGDDGTTVMVDWLAFREVVFPAAPPGEG